MTGQRRSDHGSRRLCLALECRPRDVSYANIASGPSVANPVSSHAVTPPSRSASVAIPCCSSKADGQRGTIATSAVHHNLASTWHLVDLTLQALQGDMEAASNRLG